MEWFLLGLNEEKFDMYILDIRMPGENGIEAAREIRRLYPDPVIIFITNFVDYAIEAYEVNTYRYIPQRVSERKNFRRLMMRFFLELWRKKSGTIS